MRLVVGVRTLALLTAVAMLILHVYHPPLVELITPVQMISCVVLMVSVKIDHHAVIFTLALKD